MAQRRSISLMKRNLLWVILALTALSLAACQEEESGGDLAELRAELEELRREVHLLDGQLREQQEAEMTPVVIALRDSAPPEDTVRLALEPAATGKLGAGVTVTVKDLCIDYSIVGVTASRCVFVVAYSQSGELLMPEDDPPELKERLSWAAAARSRALDTFSCWSEAAIGQPLPDCWLELPAVSR